MPQSIQKASGITMNPPGSTSHLLHSAVFVRPTVIVPGSVAVSPCITWFQTQRILTTVICRIIVALDSPEP